MWKYAKKMGKPSEPYDFSSRWIEDTGAGKVLAGSAKIFFERALRPERKLPQGNDISTKGGIHDLWNFQGYPVFVLLIKLFGRLA